jgi:hypothetical protein
MGSIPLVNVSILSDTFDLLTILHFNGSIQKHVTRSLELDRQRPVPSTSCKKIAVVVFCESTQANSCRFEGVSRIVIQFFHDEWF